MEIISTVPILTVIPFLFCVGIFGGLFNFAKGIVGAITGSKKDTSTSTSANFQSLYQQSQQQIYNLQAQIAQKKQTDWMPIAMIGGIGLIAVFLFRGK